MRPSPLKTLLKIIPIVLWMFSFSACATFQVGPKIAPLKEKQIMGKGPGKVLLLDIEGFIGNMKKRSLTGAVIQVGMVERVREALMKAEEDDEIKALLLRINTPGGTVTSSDIIYHEIKMFKRKKNIQVYVSVVDMAASGGYYIAMAGDKIVGHPTSLTGSIGVIAVKVNAGELMQKIGVDWEVVKSAEKKDFLSPLRPLTDEERKLFQFTIDSYHTRFTEVIAENRSNLNLEQVQVLADGQVYNAQQALDGGLIDKIGYLDDTVNLIAEELDIPNPKVVTYHRPGEYKSNLYSSLPAPTTINLLNIDLGLNLPTTTPHFMYLWMP